MSAEAAVAGDALQLLMLCCTADGLGYSTGWNLEANANDLSRPWYNIGCGTEL